MRLLENGLLRILSELVELRLSRANIEKYNIFEYSKVNALVESNKKGDIDASYSIWAILAIDSWVRQFSKGRNN